jgi:cytoskeleton protein RodZ
MSEPQADAAAGASAGAMLRGARERQGLHIAALAATIKITVNKLDALENDRYDELLDATFTRALALTVCRALKIDPAPVLQRLPQGGATGLSPAKGGLNTPLRERSARSDTGDGTVARRPLLWAAVLVLVAAALVYLLPAAWWQSLLPGAATPEQGALSVPVVVAVAPTASQLSVEVPSAVVPSADATAAVSSAASAAVAEEPTVRVVHSAPPSSDTSALADVPAGIAVLRVSDASWVEVIDAKTQTLVSRTVQPGETVGLDGALPFSIKIGNAQGTELMFRSQPVDLAPFTRDNVARLELK